MIVDSFPPATQPLYPAVPKTPVLSSLPLFYPLDTSPAQLRITVPSSRNYSEQSPFTALEKSLATARANNRASKLVKLFASDQSAFELEDLKGCFVEFSKDQHGSRFLQKELEVVDSDVIQVVFEEVLPVARNLMIDVYGNYVIQKFFDFGTDEQRFFLASKFQGSVVALSLHLYGCRVIQKGLETLPSYLQVSVCRVHSLLSTPQAAPDHKNNSNACKRNSNAANSGFCNPLFAH